MLQHKVHLFGSSDSVWDGQSVYQQNGTFLSFLCLKLKKLIKCSYPCLLSKNSFLQSQKTGLEKKTDINQASNIMLGTLYTVCVS